MPALDDSVRGWVIRGGAHMADSQNFTCLLKVLGHESSTLIDDQFRPGAVSRVNLRRVHPRTSLCSLIRYRVGFHISSKLSINVSKNLFLRGVRGYGPVMSIEVTWKGAVGSSTSPSGATKFLFPSSGKGHIFSHSPLLTSAWRATNSSKRSSRKFFLLPVGL